MKRYETTRSRREFLKEGAAGIAGTAFFSACSRPPQEPPQKAGNFISRTLGRTGLSLPVVSMGSEYSVNLVRMALEAGIVYIHTSSSYAEANHERMLGAAFSGLPRDSFVIATSPDLPYRSDNGSGRSADILKDVDPNKIIISLESSLRRLRLDYVDIYYLLSIGSREITLHEPYIKAYERLKKDGKTRFIGVGTHANEPEVIRAAAESGFWEVVLTAYNFRQSYRDDVSDAIRQAAQAGLGVVAMKTQAGVYWDRTRTKINMKAALKWVLQNENVHTAIPAFSNYDEMREDLSVMENLTLTPEERRDLRLGETLGLSGLYCQQCGRCLGQCPAGVDIPTLMRASMYAFGYQQPGKASAALRAWPSPDIACTQCLRCNVRCSLGMDVRSAAVSLVSAGFSPRASHPGGAASRQSG